MAEVEVDPKQVWQEMISKVTKWQDELISSTDTLESLLIDLNEKKTLRRFDEEISKCEEILKNTPQVRQTKIETYRTQLQIWKKKQATIRTRLSEIQKELDAIVPT